MAGGGIGESMLFGAAFGGAKALATGENPLEGAALGAITSGVTNQAADMILGQAAGMANPGGLPNINTSAIKTGEWFDAAGNAIQPLPANTVENLVAGPQAQIVAQNAENLGINTAGREAYLNPQSYGANLNAIEKAGGYVPGQNYVGAGGGWNPNTDINAIAPSREVVTAPRTMTGGIRDAFNIQPGGTVAKGLDWVDKNPAMAGGALGFGYGALTAEPPTIPTPEKYKSKLASMSADYEPLNNPTPVYPRFAEGGIAAMASGGINMPTQANVDFMGGDMYPQSQQRNSFYASPTQMPTSAQQAMASYEPNTNPLTGQPVAHMAVGGSTSQYIAGTGPFSKAFESLIEQMTPSQRSEFFNSGMGTFVGFHQPEQGPTIYNSDGSIGGAGTNSLYTPATISPNFQASTTNPNDFKPMAEGGIAGYSLGGYAAGGNPRLLKGPGDGMSDDIPATIGHKQPARLADGEFVVPADVVSHLGNGSTDAGAKHLYAMMDNVRKARTGNKKQGKQIKADKYLPA